ncbi:dolichol-phosphate mannosyltransferase subunit 3 [Chrysoperla carnea]|uniref:dolichol-phosphate mannosyltransferase subunit 3 n=1 Tax=Chrysoperla carnea TaxID=189513 RepID=UPI001D081BBD|nr:dolichol-phosphate mannosyltransferase subunit 3 [Chrysoperla carnea]
MTKLMEWLFGFSILSAIWLTLVTKKIENDFTRNNPELILISPIILIGLFGIYAVTVVLYRVFTFNNCEKAAEELQKQIAEARKDLLSKGIALTQ